MRGTWRGGWARRMRERRGGRGWGDGRGRVRGRGRGRGGWKGKGRGRLERERGGELEREVEGEWERERGEGGYTGTTGGGGPTQEGVEGVQEQRRLGEGADYFAEEDWSSFLPEPSFLRELDLGDVRGGRREDGRGRGRAGRAEGREGPSREGRWLCSSLCCLLCPRLLLLLLLLLLPFLFLLLALPLPSPLSPRVLLPLTQGWKVSAAGCVLYKEVPRQLPEGPRREWPPTGNGGAGR